MKSGIDIVIPWVDEKDKTWQLDKERTEQKHNVNRAANSNVRYESWDNLQYLFRGIEKFMSWADRVFLVTYGHLPAFLNTNHPKLKIVKHTDYIPTQYLPTFNSNVIELNYHRIDDLSENFVLFNDDCFPLKPIPAEYYFRNDLPCDEAVESPIMPVDVGTISNYSCYVKANNILLINKHFNKREVQEVHREKWYDESYGELLQRNIGLSYWYNFAGFHDYHMPVPLKKTTLRRIWEKEYERLDQMCYNSFRTYSDLSQAVIRYWQLCEGDFVPQKSEGKPYLVTIDNCAEVAEAIKEPVSQMVCVTEDCTENEFIVIKAKINEALAYILPDKCSFEK